MQDSNIAKLCIYAGSFGYFDSHLSWLNYINYLTPVLTLHDLDRQTRPCEKQVHRCVLMLPHDNILPNSHIYFNLYHRKEALSSEANALLLTLKRAISRDFVEGIIVAQ